MGVMSCMVDVGTMTLQGAINHMGTMTIAAHTAARKVIDMVCTFTDSAGVAIATFTSQNHGAGRDDRVREGIRHTMLFNFAVATVMLMGSLFFGREFIALMTGTTKTALIDTAMLYLNINAPFFYVLSVFFVLRSALQGLGSRVIPLVSALMELVGKIIAVWLLVPGLGYLGICITEPVIWSLCTVVFIIAYCFYARKLSKKQLKSQL